MFVKFEHFYYYSVLRLCAVWLDALKVNCLSSTKTIEHKWYHVTTTRSCSQGQATIGAGEPGNHQFIARKVGLGRLAMTHDIERHNMRVQQWREYPFAV
jgi:hypothetical protein